MLLFLVQWSLTLCQVVEFYINTNLYIFWLCARCQKTFSPELQPFSQKFVTIVLTFSLKIILRQFLSPFHKDYLTTNFNLTTKITLTIKILSQVYSIQHYVIKFVSDLRQVVNGFLRVLQCSPPIQLTDILLKGALNTINHLPQQPSFISIAQ